MVISSESESESCASASHFLTSLRRILFSAPLPTLLVRSMLCSVARASAVGDTRIVFFLDGVSIALVMSARVNLPVLPLGLILRAHGSMLCFCASASACLLAQMDSLPSTLILGISFFGRRDSLVS